MQGHPISAHLRTQIITQTSILISPLSANFEDTRIPLKVEDCVNNAFPQVAWCRDTFHASFILYYFTSPITIQGGIEPGTSGTGAVRLTTRPQQLLES